MKVSTFVPKARTILTTAVQIVTVLGFVVPVVWWIYSTTAVATEAKARVYILRVVDDRITDLEQQVQEQTETTQALKESVDKLVRGQGAEAHQSAGEANVNREILEKLTCILEPATPRCDH